MLGEKIYSVTAKMTGAVDFGVSLDDILSGKTPPPPQGARFDLSFEGAVEGKINGTMTGTDYIILRGDGCVQLDIRAAITTKDGHRISATIGGVGTPRADAPIADLREHVRLTTASTEYAWVNTAQIFAVGTVNLAEGTIKVDGYM